MCAFFFLSYVGALLKTAVLKQQRLRHLCVHNMSVTEHLNDPNKHSVHHKKPWLHRTDTFSNCQRCNNIKSTVTDIQPFKTHFLNMAKTESKLFPNVCDPALDVAARQGEGLTSIIRSTDRQQKLIYKLLHRIFFKTQNSTAIGPGVSASQCHSDESSKS